MGDKRGSGRGAVVDLSGSRRLSIGNENFQQVVKRGVFVDKSPLIGDLLDSAYSAVLFCRPRRFGKSLAMRMLQAYFECPVEGYVEDSRALFEQLAIWRMGDDYRREQGAHPVIFLSLGSASADNWDSAVERISGLIADECNRHGYLLESSRLSQAEKRYLGVLANGEGSATDVEASLGRLSSMLARHHGAGTVILIDEYDQVVTAGHAHGYRDAAISFMRNWLTTALKATTSLFLSCMTGVQRISRESIFSGLNNIEVNTALNTEFTEGFGFTEAEVAELCRHLGAQDRLPQMRDWYDGYSFGGTLVYNPWSALNYLNKGFEAQSYWGNTSDNAIVHELFQKSGYRQLEDLAALARGEHITRPLDLSTVFEELGQSETALWSQLYLAGYVTADDVSLPNDAGRRRPLRIPNREVAELFKREFLERSTSLAGSADRLESLHGALVSGDEAGFVAALKRIFYESASSFDLVRENSYHMLLLGLLASVRGYDAPTSNLESGAGRYDIALQPDAYHADALPGIVLELKWGSKSSTSRLNGWANDALAQIEDRDYAARVHGSGILEWGIACSGKNVVAVCRRSSG